MAVDCLECRSPLEKPEAVIVICPRSDAISCRYYLCPKCDVWTVERWEDDFMGDDRRLLEGPYPRASGDAAVAKIRQCPTPSDKWCDCDVHKAWL